MKVLDTDFLIAVLRKAPEVKAKLDDLSVSDEPVVTTIFNAQEILFGALLSRDQQNYPRTQRFLSTMNILDYNLECAHHALEIKIALQKKGTSIGTFDELIAGICLAHGATLVTRNLKHFKQVLGLEIESW
jgi:predicted nucleic acid-binding protein